MAVSANPARRLFFFFFFFSVIKDVINITGTIKLIGVSLTKQSKTNTSILMTLFIITPLTED